MRLIDADRLLAEIKTLPIMSNWGETFFPRLVQDQPTVDAEPVVRCKDCIYNIDGLCFCRRPLGSGVAVEPDNFCSWGETE